VINEMLEMVVDRSREVHDMARIAVANRGQHQQFPGNQPSGAVRDSRGADDIDIQRQMRPVLLDRAAGHEADLVQVDGVVVLGSGEFFVTKFCGGAAHGFGDGFGIALDSGRMTFSPDHRS
jgi:hypothetical protein